MEKWNQDKRRDVVMVDIDQLVPSDHIHARRFGKCDRTERNC